MTHEQMIDNAATASQNLSLLDDNETRIAILLNIIDPCRKEERQRAVDIIIGRLPLYDLATQNALKECISSIRG